VPDLPCLGVEGGKDVADRSCGSHECAFDVAGTLDTGLSRTSVDPAPERRLPENGVTVRLMVGE
jgi:hypothetical protein